MNIGRVGDHLLSFLQGTLKGIFTRTSTFKEFSVKGPNFSFSLQ